MRAILPAIATLAILCAACSDTTASPDATDVNREAVASVVGGVTYPLVAISPAIAALKPADSVNLQANLTDTHGAWKGKYIVWKSSDSTILKVTTRNTGNVSGSIGHVVALKAGTATISATTQSMTADKQPVTVSVKASTPGDSAVTKVVVTPNPLTIATNKPFQLTAKAYNKSGVVIPNAQLTYHSTNTAILTVSNTGLIIGAAKGTANVEVSSNGKMAWSTVTDSGGKLPPVVSAPGTGTGKGVAPVWSDKFVSSVGVATHFNYWDLLPYGNNVNSTISAIKAGGFRFIRDGLSVDVNAGSNNRYWGVMKQLTSQGIKLVLVTQPAYLGNNQFVKAPYSNQSNLDTAVNRVGASNILAFEGPNEVDNNNGSWGGIPAYGANTKAYMSAMYKHAKQIAPSVNVIGLTTTSSYGSSFIGDISSFMDAGTIHPYPNGTLPLSALQASENNSGVLNAAHKPWWVTETGYYTAPRATTGVYQPGVSEAAQGKYVPRLYLDYFNAGIVHTSVYEIIDEHVSQADAEANYGLMRNDGSPKPAYTAMKNMLNLLADPGASFTPSTPLDYSLTGATNTVRQALFQKRDGRFYLVLWNDVVVYNTSAKTDVANGNVPVVVNFTTAPRSISKYQPLLGASGTAVTSSKTVAVSVADNPIILEITR
jgi:Big-like domain-containing protein